MTGPNGNPIELNGLASGAELQECLGRVMEDCPAPSAAFVVNPQTTVWQGLDKLRARSKMAGNCREFVPSLSSGWAFSDL